MTTRVRSAMWGAALAVAVLVMGLPAPAQALPNAPMVLTVTTDTPNQLVALPLNGTVTGVTVDWGDSTTSGPYNAAVSAQHTYASTGAHQITISGTKLEHFGPSDALPLVYTSTYVTSVTSFGTIGITDLSKAFSGATQLTSVPATLPPGVTNLAKMFEDAENFNQPIGAWNTSSVTDMESMFQGASRFNQPIGAWDTSKVTDMRCMFFGAVAFDQPLGAWNTSSVTDMSGMFSRADSFNRPIGGWDTSKVTGMADMFRGAETFDQPLRAWDTSSVTNMSGMFAMWSVFPDDERFDPVFNQPIGTWNTSKVSDFANMFYGNALFNQPLDGWDTSSAIGMESMFEGATSFNQPLASWRVPRLANMSMMFGATPLFSVENYSDLLASLAAQPTQSNVNLDAPNSSYWGDAAVTGRATLVSRGWNINDAGVAIPPTSERPLIASGNPTVGQTVVTGSHRIYHGTPTPTVRYRWQSSPDGTTGWIDVPGAQQSSLVVPMSLVGRFLRSVATATNGALPNDVTVSRNVIGPVAAIAPTQPRSVGATPRNGGVSVVWSSPVSTGGARIKSYIAQAVPVAGGSARTCSALAPTRTCIISGLTNGVRYSVSVKATNNAALTSAWSAAVTVTPRTVPGTVRSLVSAFPVTLKTVLTWTAPASNGGSSITSYQVRWKAAGATTWSSWVSTALTRSSTKLGLQKGVTVYAQVRALNAAGGGLPVTLSVTPTR